MIKVQDNRKLIKTIDPLYEEIENTKDKCEKDAIDYFIRIATILIKSFWT